MTADGASDGTADGTAAGHVLAIDFGATKVALATADADGRVLDQLRLDTRAVDGAREVVRRAVAAGRDLADRTAGATGGKLTAVGVASFGVTLADRVLLAPNVPGWHELALPTLLREGLAEPAGLAEGSVRVANDVKAATAAELRWGELAGADTGIYVNLGTGLACGLVVGGRVLDGAHGTAGEIGYNVRSFGEPAVAAGHAPLEEHVSGRALADRGGKLLGRPVTAADLFARQDDERVRSFVRDALEQLAVHVTNLAVAIDPERVVVGGGMMHAADVILPVLRTQLADAAPFPVDLRQARYSHDAALRGAVALALA
ncbi:ROK family protein [Streptomyces bathyalis]|uniref:ROK family protein n=1 Tax=Streptomyces bathyalis TaxID=2710756 RepID=A0A7T1T831_9ACTN|nr:ROK family protein [Streptomyces bathyalis]QPP08137.1 ROK family protein [Streptomyces bathyalis]